MRAFAETRHHRVLSCSLSLQNLATFFSAGVFDGCVSVLCCVPSLVMPIIARLLNYCDLRNNDLLPSSQSIRSVINTPDWHSRLCSFNSDTGEVSMEKERRPSFIREP